MLFGLALELIVWGTTPGWGSWAGSGCILGSVVWVGMKKAEKADIAKVRVVDEEVGLMSERLEGEVVVGNELMEIEDGADAWRLDRDEDGEDGEEEDKDGDENGESRNLA